MLHVGFTGTRFGMTAAQLGALATVVAELRALHAELCAHHGDCVGADAQFHDHVVASGPARTIGHPGPDGDTHRAGCVFDERRDPLTHMKRNRTIVTEADVMIAAPYEPTEQERGGTWATIRMARKAKKPLALLLSDGTIQRERWLPAA